MAVDQGIWDALTAENLKVSAGHPVFATNMAALDVVMSRKRLDIIAEAATGNIIKNLTELDAIQSKAASEILTGDKIAEKISNLEAALAQNQMASKTAGNTPPVTP